MDDQSGSIYVLARNIDGCWQLLEGLGEVKERFVSFEAALAFVNDASVRPQGATIAISCAQPGPGGVDEARR